MGHRDLQDAEPPSAQGLPARTHPAPAGLVLYIPESAHCYPHHLPEPCRPPKSSPAPLYPLLELPTLLRVLAGPRPGHPFCREYPCWFCLIWLYCPGSLGTGCFLQAFPLPHDTSKASWMKHTRTRPTNRRDARCWVPGTPEEEALGPVGSEAGLLLWEGLTSRDAVSILGAQTTPSKQPA